MSMCNAQNEQVTSQIMIKYSTEELIRTSIGSSLSFEAI